MPIQKLRRRRGRVTQRPAVALHLARNVAPVDADANLIGAVRDRHLAGQHDRLDVQLQLPDIP